MGFTYAIKTRYLYVYLSHTYLFAPFCYFVHALFSLYPKNCGLLSDHRGGGIQCRSSAELWDFRLSTRFTPPIISVFHPHSSSGQTSRISTFAIPCTRDRRIGDSGCVHQIMEPPSRPDFCRHRAPAVVSVSYLLAVYVNGGSWVEHCLHLI